MVAAAAPVAAAAGDLDDTFSGNGWLTIDFGGDGESASALAIQSDGKIVVAGSVDGDFGVARLNTNGTLDDTFNGDGRVRTDLRFRDPSLIYDHANEVAVQPDGKMVVVGGSGKRFAVVRYTTAGKLDKTFRGDGKLVFKLNAGSTSKDELFTVAIMGDGRIVLGGSTGDPSQRHLALIRLTPDGGLDPTFSQDGKKEIWFDQAPASTVGMSLDGGT